MNENEAYAKGAQDHIGKTILLTDYFKIFPEREESKGCKQYFRLIKRLYNGTIVIMEYVSGIPSFARDAPKPRVFCIEPEKDLERVKEDEVFSALMKDGKLIIKR